MGFGRRLKRSFKKVRGAAFNPKLGAKVVKTAVRNPGRGDKLFQRQRTTGKRTMVKTLVQSQPQVVAASPEIPVPVEPVAAPAPVEGENPGG